MYSILRYFSTMPAPLPLCWGRSLGQRQPYLAICQPNRSLKHPARTPLRPASASLRSASQKQTQPPLGRTVGFRHAVAGFARQAARHPLNGPACAPVGCSRFARCFWLWLRFAGAAGLRSENGKAPRKSSELSLYGGVERGLQKCGRCNAASHVAQGRAE